MIEKILGGWGTNFPVIHKAGAVVNGIRTSITSIKSLDLLVKTYQSGSLVYGVIMRYANSLANSTSTMWNNTPVFVGTGTQRILELAVPPGASSEQMLQINKANCRSGEARCRNSSEGSEVGCVVVKFNHRTVMVYIDEKNNLIANPTGESERYGLTGLDIVHELNAPYSDDQLGCFLRKAMSKCYSQKADDMAGLGPLEKHLEVTSFAKAVKRRRLVNFCWHTGSGYTLIPTEKRPRQGFVHLDGKAISVEAGAGNGELGLAFREAMKLSVM